MNRWILLTARLGIVLLLLGAGLFLANLMTPANATRIGGLSEVFSSQTFDIQYSSTPELLNPQTGIQITVDTNGTLDFRIFSLDRHTVQSALNTSLPSQNSQILDQFTTEYSSHLVRDYEVTSGKTVIAYVPPDVENVTIIVTNPTSTAVSWSYQTDQVNVIASQDRLSLALGITVVLGVAMTVPWLALSLRRKAKIPEIDETSAYKSSFGETQKLQQSTLAQTLSS